MRKNVLFLFIVCQFAAYNVIAQMDDEFWFAAPAISEYGPGYLFDRPIKFNIASFSSSPISVSISLPANSAFAPINVIIPANGFESVDMTPYLNAIINTPANAVLNRGILIKTAGGLINVSYEVALGKNSTEAYSLKGKVALGTYFLLPGQNEYSNYASASPQNLNRMDIVATDDGTAVTITPSVNIAGHSANVPFTVYLEKGQTYSCIALGVAAGHHFHGTEITSNKPIAITQTDDNLNDGEGQDLIGDQIIPVEYLGNEYIAVKGTLRGNEEKVYVLGVTNGTAVYVGSNPTPVRVINKGETLQIGFAGQPALYITSDKPIYAYQLTGINIELGSAILPTIECTGSDAVKYRRGSAGSNIFRLNLCVQAGGEYDFLYNGNPGIITPSEFSDVPGTNGTWKYVSKDFTNITPTNSLAFVSNTSQKFHMGVFEGGLTTGCTYGFYSGYGSSFELRASMNETGRLHYLCEGDSLVLEIRDTVGLQNFEWTGPDGFKVSSSKTVIAPLTFEHAGSYYVIAETIDNLCRVTPDSVLIRIKPKPVINLGDDIVTCNKSIVLDAKNMGADYIWNDGEIWQQTIVTESGKYWVEVNDGGCINSDTLNVTILEIPEVEIIQDGYLCKDSIVILKVEKNVGDIAWSTGGVEAITPVTTPGMYWVEVTNGICITKDSILIEKVDIDSLVITSEGSICIEGKVTITASSDGDSFSWNNGETTPVIEVEDFATYYVTVFNDFCSLSDSLVIEFCCPKKIQLPNVITPSRMDGLNDYFQFPPELPFKKMTTHIYNRWGKTVLKTTDPNFKWDGKVNGKVILDTYHYVIQLEDGCSFHGTITVM